MAALLLRRAALASLLCLAGAAAWAQEPLPILARVGPWPEASGLIGFQGRLWLVNSVKWRNHNSADIYSYDPATGALTYERHLFSQDAGRPVVRAGLLYWPFEDSRFSLGWGHFMVTDGRRWRFRTIPAGRIFHSHAMVELAGGRLMAADSAWRAGLDVSDDDGLTWRRLYEHPTPQGGVSRIVDLVALGDRAIGPLTAPDERRLLRADGESVTDLPGWPRDRRLFGATTFRGWFYGLVGEESGTAVWRSDGRRSERVGAAHPGWGAVSLAAGADGLWAAGRGPAGGALWFSAEGETWRVAHSLPGGEPREVAVYAGRPYVAGAGEDGRGILWGPPPPAAVEPGSPPAPAAAILAAADPSGARASAIDWADAGARLDAALLDPESYTGHGGALRDLVYGLALAGPPAGFFATRLSRPVPVQTLSLIGGHTQARAAQLARWILLWGMAVAGGGEVPPDLLAEPWTAPPNRAEKYFETAPIAMWAVAEVGQGDAATIDALIERLERAGDPDWLKGDAVGALSAITGRRFGYDAAAWRKWWSAAASR